MKLEIIKEEEYNKPTWYILKLDERTIDCSRNLEEVEKFYEKIKQDPTILNSSKTILKSEEIILNL